ncbi:hypothetical protein [Amycolatopsis suaedae]|uniref:hypothetical protein n=1 Tax=Amycolatopsis suaedae TaxID=2510978 RepID=UPI001F0E429F|nr:hypothetical protein [Amycolatopsis suaedae]
MAQLSLLSAEATGPRPADLAGMLCGHGRLTGFGRMSARLSAVLDEPWRARALAGELRRRGVQAELARDEDEQLMLRTAFRADLTALAAAWGCLAASSAKAVPEGFRLDGGTLRLWALTAGRPVPRGYLLAMDPGAPCTHERLSAALCTLGLPNALLGAGSDTPGLRISGRRRLHTFAELIGEPPRAAEGAWPEIVPVARAG